MWGAGGRAHLLSVHLNLVVGGGDNDVLRGEVADIHCELVGVAQGLHVAIGAGPSCGAAQQSARPLPPDNSLPELTHFPQLCVESKPSTLLGVTLGCSGTPKSEVRPRRDPIAGTCLGSPSARGAWRSSQKAPWGKRATRSGCGGGSCAPTGKLRRISSSSTPEQVKGANGTSSPSGTGCLEGGHRAYKAPFGSRPPSRPLVKPAKFRSCYITLGAVEIFSSLPPFVGSAPPRPGRGGGNLIPPLAFLPTRIMQWAEGLMLAPTRCPQDGGFGELQPQGSLRGE